jgi:hypothetical protein
MYADEPPRYKQDLPPVLITNNWDLALTLTSIAAANIKDISARMKKRVELMKLTLKETTTTTKISKATSSASTTRPPECDTDVRSFGDGSIGEIEGRHDCFQRTLRTSVHHGI